MDHDKYVLHLVPFGTWYRRFCTAYGISSTVPHLVSAVVGDVVREFVQQQMQRVRLGEGHTLDVLKVLGGAALMRMRRINRSINRPN